MIRSESDVVLAVNLSTELIARIKVYLDLFAKYTNGCSGVFIPKETYEIVLYPFPTPNLDKLVRFKLVYTVTTSTEVIDYYDFDSDYFQEGWGYTNESGRHLEYSSERKENVFSVAMSSLMLSKDELTKHLISYSSMCASRASTQKLVNRIRDLRKNLSDAENELASKDQ